MYNMSFIPPLRIISLRFKVGELHLWRIPVAWKHLFSVELTKAFAPQAPHLTAACSSKPSLLTFSSA